MTQVLPVEYHLEFYTVSFGNDPFFSAQTSSPLMGISKGDQFDWRGFRNFPLTVAAGSVLKVAEIRHIIWEIEGDHISHKLMIAFEVEPLDA